MLITEEVKVKWHGRSKQHYIDRGYNFTKTGDVFIVKTLDLSKGTHNSIELKCDYQKDGCEDVFNIPFCDYYARNLNGVINKDCCKNPNCMKEKRKESFQKTYGCDNSNQIPEAKERRSKTCQELYGGNSPMCSPEVREKSITTLQEKYNVDNISQVEEIKQQKINTCLEHFGVENPIQASEIKEKIFNTNLIKYGVGNYTQTKECQDKIKKTNQEKYGVDSCLQIEGVHKKAEQAFLDKYGAKCSVLVPEIKNKILDSLFKNKSTPSSIQQEYLSILYNYNLNHLTNNYFLDMVNVEDKIYIEYDGGGHNLCVKLGKMTQEEFNHKERKRYYFLKNKGYKLIRIISTKDKLPSDETLLLMLQYAKEYLSTGHSWIHFDIDNSQIINSQYKINVDFGELRKITKKDIEQNQGNCK